MGLEFLSAQIPKSPVTIQTPNTASLGQYGEIPVSLYTGLPQISIPIQTITEGSASLPISLNYQATGVRPDQHPGWVGLNWSLSAGGVINRTVNDVPDDFSLLPLGGSMYQSCGTGNGLGFYYNRCRLNDPNWNQESWLTSLADLESQFDTEPDEFNFNFAGYSGKFYLDHTGQWRVACDSKIKVELLPDPVISTKPLLILPPFTVANCINSPFSNIGYPTHFGGFIITTETGVRYVFGGDGNGDGNPDTDAVEYSVDFFNQAGDNWTANAWYLTRIIDPSGRQITLSYDAKTTITAGTYTYQTRYMANQMGQSVYFRERNVTPNQPFNTTLFFLTFGLAGGDSFLSQFGCGSSEAGTPTYGTTVGKLLAPVYLKEINTSRFKVSFTHSVSTELRYDASIYTTHINYKRTQGIGDKDYLAFLFTGSHVSSSLTFCPQVNAPDPNEGFNNGNTINVEQRLQWRKLDAITISNQPSQNAFFAQYQFEYNNVATERLMLRKLTQVGKPSYQFQYFDNASITLPPYLSGKVDHWGFFNNVYADFTNQNDYTAQRNPTTSLDMALEGTLKTITYPTGGVTEFTYEQHSYGRQIKIPRWDGVEEATGTAGGLRVRKITSSDPAFPLAKVEKEYFYIRGYLPSTGLSGTSSGVLGGRVQYVWNGYQAKSSDQNVSITERIFSTQSILPASENASGAHVTYSEVVEKTSDGATTLYQFSNYDNGSLDLAPDRSLNISKTPYEPGNNRSHHRGKPLFKKIFTASGNPLTETSYTYSAVGSDFVKAVKSARYKTCSGFDARVLEATAYRLFTYPYLLTLETTKTYDQNNVNLFIQTSTQYTYNQSNYRPSQITTTSSKGIQTITYQKYPLDYSLPAGGLSKNLEAIRQMQQKNMISQVIEQYQVEGTRTLSASLTTYRKNVANANQIVPDQVYVLETPQPLTDFVPSSVENTSLKMDTRYKSRLVYNRYDNFGNLLDFTRDNVSKGYLWGYNQLFPIAEVSHSRPVGTEEENITVSNNSVGNIRAITENNSNALTFDTQLITVPSPNTITSVFTIGKGGADTQYSWVRIELTNASTGSVIFSRDFTVAGGPYTETINIPAGSFRYTHRSYGFDSNPSTYGMISVNIQTQYQVVTTATSAASLHYYHTSFEENGTIDATAPTGRRVGLGNLVIPVNQRPVAGNYLLTYWERVSGVWTYREQRLAYTPSSTPLINVVNPIDEVRLYPFEGQVTTYTYDPLLGITSSADATSVVTSYEYDEMQRLKFIRDHRGNIVRQYSYYYKQ